MKPWWLAALLLFCLAWQAHAQSRDDPIETRSVLLMLRLPSTHYRPDAAYGAGYSGAGGNSRRRLARVLAHEHALALREDWPMPALGIDCFVLVAADSAAATRAAQALARDPRVESAQPMQLFHTLGEDPLAAVQPARISWHLQELHRHATGRGVRIAVIDSGVATEHPDLRGQIAVARNFVDARSMPAESHGTQVAGVIAARADNGLGMAGIAPDSRVLALRACWETAGSGSSSAPSATCSTFTLARALQFALDARAQVFNLSLAGPRDVLLGRLLDVAMRRGVTVVAAASDARDYPASHPGVIAVSADDAAVANTWRAPGRGIPATAPDGGWSLVSGASFAAAEVSGLAALLQQHATASSAARPSRLFGDARSSSRDIDACAALGRAMEHGCVCNCATASATMAAPHR
jgi:subtilisin family serine protease